MSVYVDSAFVRYGRMLMCHMVADTEAELHAMADAIGVRRKWYQDRHYDICSSKRAVAIELGAKVVTSREGALIRRRMEPLTEGGRR